MSVRVWAYMLASLSAFVWCVEVRGADLCACKSTDTPLDRVDLKCKYACVYVFEYVYDLMVCFLVCVTARTSHRIAWIPSISLCASLSLKKTATLWARYQSCVASHNFLRASLHMRARKIGALAQRSTSLSPAPIAG